MAVFPKQYIAPAVTPARDWLIGIFFTNFSDGSGRTGTFIAISNLIERLKNENRVDIFRMAKDLRDLRPGMIETAVWHSSPFKAIRMCSLAVMSTNFTFTFLYFRSNTHFVTKRYQNICNYSIYTAIFNRNRKKTRNTLPIDEMLHSSRSMRSSQDSMH